MGETLEEYLINKLGGPNEAQAFVDGLMKFLRDVPEGGIIMGSRVVKKSGERFQNGEKVAIVTGFTTITFPCSNSRYAREKGMKTEDAVILEGCEQPIRLNKIQVLT